MPALSTSFIKTARHATLGLLAATALGTMATPAAAQEAPRDPAAAAAAGAPTTTTRTNEDGSTTTLNQITCVETYSRERRNGGFLGIIGNSRSSESSSTSNEQCRKDTRDAAVAFSLMTATNSDGTPDMPMRALGLEMYRNSSDGARQRIDTLLAAAGTDYERLVFSTTPTGAAAVCVRQPATTLPTAPAGAAQPATAGTPVRVSVSFRCTQPGAAQPAAPVSPLAIAATTDTTAVAAAADTTATTETAPPPAVAATAPRM